MRNRTEAAADVELEASLFDAIDGSDHADAAHVVHVGQAAGLVLAAGKGDLELAAEVLAVGVAQQEVHKRLSIGGYVEGLAAADAGERAGCDIADGIATGFTGGDAHRGKPAHEVGGILDVDEVDLEVLASGDVEDFL